MNLAEIIDRTTSKFYTGRIRCLSEQVGLDEHLRAQYDRLQSILTPNRTTIRVGDAEATFDTSTVTEYRRATEYIEREPIADLVAELESNDVFWDIGANTGLYACLAASVLPDGAVVGFEPHPSNIESLSSTVDINGFDNVDVENCALGNERGEVTLDVQANAPGLGLHSVSTDSNDGSMRVPMKRGDDLTEEFPQPSVVKIDVEGAEGLVIEGMNDVLADDRCRLVYCEVHASDAFTNSVSEFGYTVGHKC